jgi:hypothetical protein
MPYEDQIKGILYGDRGEEFIVFARSRRSNIRSVIKIMLQDRHGVVLNIANVKPNSERSNFVLYLRPREGMTRQFTPSDSRDECHEGLGSVFGVAALGCSLPPMLSQIPEEFWEPLPKEISDRVFLLSRLPEEHLTPLISDHPFCAFISKGSLVLALFVRKIGSHPTVAMAASSDGRVFLLRSLSQKGLFSKEIVLECSQERGANVLLTIPLSGLHPKHANGLKSFLAQSCVQQLGQSNGVPPEGSFASADFLRQNWI